MDCNTFAMKGKQNDFTCTDDNPLDATPNGCNLLSPTSLVCFEFLFWPKYQNIDVGRLEL